MAWLKMILGALGPVATLVSKLINMFKSTTAEKVQKERDKVLKEREELEKDPNKRPPKDIVP